MSDDRPPAGLLHLDARDVRGLVWLQNRAQSWEYTLKRQRKYSVRRGAEFSVCEALTFEALKQLEAAAASLLLDLARSGSRCAPPKASGKVRAREC